MLSRDFIRASSTLAGAIIGVGIFGAPFVFAQAGFLIGTVLLLYLASVVLVLHLMFGEVIERTEGTHRFIGYASIYFGHRAKIFSTASVLIGVYAALVAYILVANEFLNTLFGPLFSIPFLWAFIFWAVMGAGIIMGIRRIARAEVFMLLFLLIAFGVIIVRGMPLVEFSHFSYINLQNLFLPYGVILFSLVGFAALPGMRSLIGGNGKTYRNAIIAGSLVAAFVTFAFAVVVLGVSGEATSKEAISGLLPYLGGWVVGLGAILGVLAIATSFLVFGVNLRNTFVYDWNMNKKISDILVLAVPMLLLLMGIRNFINMIGVAGAVFGAIDGTIIVLLYRRAKKHGTREPSFSLHVPYFVSSIIIVSLVGGGIYAILNILV